MGVAPKAKVFATKIFAGETLSIITGTMESLVMGAYNAGSRVSSNSWGADVFGGYDNDAQLFDRMTRDASSANGIQPMTFVFSAGNSGQGGAQTIGSPGTAKNVITVGAGENSDKGQIDKSGMGPTSADDLRDIAVFSSRGPMLDGRLAPTLFAPGTHVSGAASDDPKFDGSGVSGRPAGRSRRKPQHLQGIIPPTRTTIPGAAAPATPCPTVAGAVALLYEYYKKVYGSEPSPALVKAMLVAGAVDTAGGNRNFLNVNSIEKLAPIPNNDAGWGRCSLVGLVDNTRTVFKIDQSDLMSFHGPDLYV